MPALKDQLKTRAAEFWRRNSPLAHFFLVLALLYCGYLALHAFDPRIGVEGFGDLFGFGLNLAGITIVVYTAFWLKNHIWRDLTAAEEETLFVKALAGDSAAIWLLIRDRLEWVFLLCFLAYWVFK